MAVSCISGNIRAIINAKGLKNKVVAERAGFSVQQFSGILTKRRLIRDVDIMAISNALDVTPNELFGIYGEERGVERSDDDG